MRASGPGMHRGFWVLTLWMAAMAVPRTAIAAGTFFLVELNTGVGESAYRSGGPIGLNYGVSGGVTFKLKALPIRWYVLGNLIGRNAWVSGEHLDVHYSATRTDLDTFASFRSVLPVWKKLRLFAEFGIGARHQYLTIDRGRDLETLESRTVHFLIVVAAGLQVRLNQTFSVGLRSEITPYGNGPDLAAHAAGVLPTSNRISGFATLGIHF